jgi:hypothetical protein
MKLMNFNLNLLIKMLFSLKINMEKCLHQPLPETIIILSSKTKNLKKSKKKLSKETLKYKGHSIKKSKLKNKSKKNF